MRVAALLLLASLAQAGTELFEVDSRLWPDGVEYSFEKPAAEAHLLLAFKSGLGTMGERGTAALASAQFVVEYNDADRQTCYWNRYRPLPFEAEVNPEWQGDDEAPGLYMTEGESATLVDRVLVLRLPRVNRWRIRVTPLYGDTEAVRRDATLVQVAEVRDAKPRVFEELDPLPVEEVEVHAEAEEAEPLPVEELPAVDEQREEPVAWTEVVSVGNAKVRTIRAGSVPQATGYYAANRAARRRAAGGNRGAWGNPADPTWQPLPSLQPSPTPLPFPRPVGGAPVAGKVPPWGAPLPFWAVPKPRAKAPPQAPRVPVPPTGASRGR
ncbi:MAG TPA: hypothetical protein VFY93_04550 [Planctomycetota bacterium]|nr:hypothetical protein [Planctomycetota bacterium]